MNNDVVTRPDFVEEEHLQYLDELRTSDVVNMWGADLYLKDAFGIDQKRASAILAYWMNTFVERHTKE